MRTILFALLTLVALGGCRKEVPTPAPTPTPTPTPQPGVPTVSLAEVEAYYSLDKTADITVAETKITATTGEKTIGGKRIQILQTKISNSNSSQGSFTLEVTKGLVNGKTFTGSYQFSGFKQVKRPDDVTLGRRMQVAWRVAPEVYLRGIELEALYLDGKADWFTAEALAPYVRFYSSSASGEQYELTAEEVKSLQLKEVKYSTKASGSGELTFKTVYKGTTSDAARSLEVNINDYYAQRLPLNKDFPPTRYMRGIYEYLDLYISSLITYDTRRYAALLKSDSKQEQSSANTLSFTIELHRQGAGADQVIATIPFTVSGFKPLTNLEKDLYISHDSEFIETMSTKLKGWNKKEDLSAYLNRGLENWITKTQWVFRYPGNPQNLVWGQKQLAGGSQLLLSGASGEDKGRDIYLLAPRLRVTEARLEGTTLKATMELLGVNEVAFDKPLRFPFSVLSLKLN